MHKLKHLLQKRRTKLFIAASAILIIGIIVGAQLISSQRDTASSLSENTTKQQPRDTTESSSDPLITKPTLLDPEAVQQGVPGVETTDENPGSAAFPTTQPNLSVDISNVKQSRSQLLINTLVTPAAEGTCTYELTREGQISRTKVTPINEQQCSDGILPLDGVAAGEWTLTVKVTVSSNVATATRPVTIEGYYTTQ